MIKIKEIDRFGTTTTSHKFSFSNNGIKLLWLSDSVDVNSGYARVGKEVLTRLTKKGYDCYNIGHQTTVNHNVEGIKILKGDGEFGKKVINQYLNQINPDVFITLNDPWNTNYVTKFFPKNESCIVPHIGYFALDSEYVPPILINDIATLDKPLAMSRNSYNKINDIGIKCDYIPHGCDTNKFKPIEKERIQSIRKSLDIKDDEIVVGYVSKNQFRKQLDRTFRACGNLKYRYKIKLLLVTPSNGWDLQHLSKRYGIPIIQKFNVSDQELNELYNIMDVHMLLTSGEGFGLTLLESQAAGVPNITVDYTTGPELVMDDLNGYLVKATDYLVSINGTDRALADTDEASEKLRSWIQLSDEDKQTMRENAREFSKQYDWDKVADMWDEYIKKSIGVLDE